MPKEIESSEPAIVPWWKERTLLLMMGLIFCCYFLRLGYLPMVGEEPRWARGASIMLETGDWIVPRQQMQVFPERPPMSSWAMALVGMVTGEVNAYAARLPSVFAILLTTILIYGYGRSFLSPLGATTAALAFGTFGQVLQIGRHGESEALFTLLVAGSLLLFHWGYRNKWSSLATWCSAYSCMALAALVKGPQAPIYFCAVIGFYLVFVRRDWKYLFGATHFAGIALGATIIAAWQIPFYLMTDLDSVTATWGGLAGDRFNLQGLFEHIATYPLETFVCLLPWSPILLMFCYPGFARTFIGSSKNVQFLVIAFLVTYPSVLFASGAKGRYFMPLYPCLALLIGALVQELATSADSLTRLRWKRFLVGFSVFAIAATCIVVAASLGVANSNPDFHSLAQPAWFVVLFLAVSIATVVFSLQCCRTTNSQTSLRAVFQMALFMAVCFTSVAMNNVKQRTLDPESTIAKLKASLPSTENLISFGSIDHRFCYYFGDLICEKEWPSSIADVPENLDYFFMSYRESDTPQHRITGRGRSWHMTHGSLPFEWEEVEKVTVCRSPKRSHRQVMLARVKRNPNGQIAVRTNFQVPKIYR